MGKLINYIYVFVAGLALGAVAVAQDLTIKGGDVRTIQVDKVVIVKEDVLAVSKFPFTVNAPAASVNGFGLYKWIVPSGVTFSERDEVIEITAAPEGMLTVSCDYIVVETVPAVKVTKKKSSVKFAIGVVKPQPPDLPPTGTVKHLSFVGPTVATAATVTDAGLRSWLKSGGITVHVIPEVDVAKYKLTNAVAKAGGVPCFVLQDESGNVLDQAKTTTVEAVKELVKPFTRKQ